MMIMFHLFTYPLSRIHFLPLCVCIRNTRVNLRILGSLPFKSHTRSRPMNAGDLRRFGVADVPGYGLAAPDASTSLLGALAGTLAHTIATLRRWVAAVLKWGI